MSVLDVIAFGIAAIAVWFAATCYVELHRWARQCQHARIAIAHKRKVKLQAPLVEWLLWCNQLDKDKDSSGRVVYSIGGTTVAITKAVIPPGRIRAALSRHGRDRPAQSAAPSARKGSTRRPPPSAPLDRGGQPHPEGRYEAQDDTPAANRVAQIQKAQRDELARQKAQADYWAARRRQREEAGG